MNFVLDCDNGMFSFKETPVENKPTHKAATPTQTPVEKTASPPQGKVSASKFVFHFLHVCFCVICRHFAFYAFCSVLHNILFVVDFNLEIIYLLC